MKLMNVAVAVAVAVGGLAAAAPATAQKKAEAKQRNFKISPQAQKAIVELQTAVTANDSANIPVKLAAAKAVARTPDDKYVIGQLQLQAAVKANDNAGIAAAIETMLASGGAQASELPNLRINLAKTYYQLKQYDRAAPLLDQLLAANPNDTDALVLLAETRRAQGRPNEAVAVLQRGIAAKKAAGQPVPEAWYKHALAMAFKSKLPSALQLSREWAAAYPSASSWHDAVAMHQTIKGGGETNLDLYRLMRHANAMISENDYYRYANAALVRGLPGEAKAVLDEGIAAKKIDKSSSAIGSLYAVAAKRAAADRLTLAATEKSGMAAAAAKPAMVAGDVFLGIGDYAKAAALYRAALGKPGVDANLANLRLGIALARQGDNAGATAALQKVSGTQAEIAQYWLTYLGRRA